MEQKSLRQELIDNYGYTEENGFPAKRAILYMELVSSQDLNAISPVIDQIVYVQNMDISFRYNGTEWEQCGETAIYRGGLISGKLYVNELKVG